MASTGLKYDPECQKRAFQDSLYAGKYALETPLSCQPCYQANPQIRLQKNGGSISQNEKNLRFRGPVDVESDLMNLNKVASKCPSKSHRALPRSNGLFSQTTSCYFPVDNTRLTNPASNLREQESLRLDFPCTDPQANVFFPGRWHIDTRQEAKDNHRPCIEVPQMEEGFVNSAPQKENFKSFNS